MFTNEPKAEFDKFRFNALQQSFAIAVSGTLVLNDRNEKRSLALESDTKGQRISAPLAALQKW